MEITTIETTQSEEQTSWAEGQNTQAATGIADLSGEQVTTASGGSGSQSPVASTGGQVSGQGQGTQGQGQSQGNQGQGQGQGTEGQAQGQGSQSQGQAQGQGSGEQNGQQGLAGQEPAEGQGKQGQAQGQGQEGQGAEGNQGEQGTEGQGQETGEEAQGGSTEEEAQGGSTEGQAAATQAALSGLTEDQKMEFMNSIAQEEGRTWTEKEIRDIAYAVFSEDWSGLEQCLDMIGSRIQAVTAAKCQAAYEGMQKQIESEFAELKAIRPKTLVIKPAAGQPGEPVALGLVHEATKKILSLLSQNIPVFLTGPAGSGKTTCAEKVAEALSLTFHPVSVGPETMKSDLLGFIDGNGHYHTTPVREAFEKGGLLLLDEMDAGNGASMTILNSLIANGYCSFPDRFVKRHPQFRIIAAANTFGRGADRLYVGRNQLDAATLDRFFVQAFDYDEALERRLAGNDAWVDRVQEIRHKASELKLRVVVSPRASIMGAKLLAAGIPQSQVEEGLIFKYDESFRRKIKEAGVQA